MTHTLVSYLYSKYSGKPKKSGWGKSLSGVGDSPIPVHDNDGRFIRFLQNDIGRDKMVRTKNFLERRN